LLWMGNLGCSFGSHYDNFTLNILLRSNKG
jgi:hypothetical protein